MQSPETEQYRSALTQIVQNCDCRSHPVEERSTFPDVVEQAVVSHSRYVEELNEEIRVSICEAAHRALARFETGEFGRCVDCGQQISPKRLAAVPWTDRCVECQEDQETTGILQPAA